MTSPVVVTRVVNASVLLELGNVAVLTDPYFEDHWFMRYREPIGVAVAQLPELAAIVGGHGVFDHWAPRSLRTYRHRATTPVFVPTRSMARSARRAGFREVEVLTWWERRHVGDRVTITSVPGERVTGMTTNSYVLSNDDITVFVGTEARSLEPIREVARRFHVDLAILPIDGARLLGHRLVMDAARAIEAARILAAHTLVPIHYAQRPVPGVLRCPSGLEDLLHRAMSDDLRVIATPTGRRVAVLDAGLAHELRDGVAHVDDAALHHPDVQAAEVELATDG